MKKLKEKGLSEERILAFDSVLLEKRIIAEDDKTLTMPAVIASEIVHRYNDGMAYKPDYSLKKAFDVVSRIGSLPLTILKHPDVGLITLNSEVHGRVDNFEYVKNLVDAKTNRPCRKGIRADLTWFKDLVAPNILEAVKKGDIKDVSIGFTFKKIPTSGDFNGDKYDYIQDDIFLNHVAAPVERGRCPGPICGINVDSITFEIAGDPWEVTDKYIRSGHGTIKEGMQCRTSDYNGKLPDGILAVSCHMPDSDEWWEQSFLFPKDKGWDLAKAKAWFSSHKKDAILEKIAVAITKDKMSVEQIQTKIEELYETRDKIQEESNAGLKPEKASPEVQKKWQQIEDLDLEIRAYKELKAKQIVEGKVDCPICKDIEELGLKRTAKMLVLNLGLDNVVSMFESEKIGGPYLKMQRVDEPKKVEEPAVARQVDMASVDVDALIQRVENQRKLSAKILA